ncbi:MAG: hypothetical protein ACOC0D_01785 [Spirochaeta sp.]
MSLELMVIACAAVFYVGIPAAGAFHVRRRWRRLRSRIIDSLDCPKIQYHDQGQAAQATSRMVIGERRMAGAVDAVEGDSVLWLSNDEVSVAVDMTGQNVVLLAGTQENLLKGEDIEVGASLVIIPWKRMFTISQGTQIFVVGEVIAESGRLCFRRTPESDLLIVLFEGTPQLVLYRSIWNARQRNEFINQTTPGSMTLGSAGLLLLSYFLLIAPGGRLWGLIALTLSFTPVLPLLPPGVIMYFFFRRLWRRARMVRSQRDVLRMAMECCRSDSFSCRDMTRDPVDTRSDGNQVLRAYGDNGTHCLLVEPKEPDGGGVPDRLLVPTESEQLIRSLERKAYRLECVAVLLFLFGQLCTTYVLFVLLSYAV